MKLTEKILSVAEELQQDVAAINPISSEFSINTTTPFEGRDLTVEIQTVDLEMVKLVAEIK